LLLPNTEEFKLALRKAKEYVKYNEYLRSSVVAGSDNGKYKNIYNNYIYLNIIYNLTNLL